MSAIFRHVNAIVLIFFGIWIVILLFIAFPMISTHVSPANTETVDRLAKALADLEILRKQNNELQELFRDIKLGDFKSEEKEAIENFQMRLTKVEHPKSKRLQDVGFVSQKEEPNSQYEILRRRIATNTKELFYYVRGEMHNLKQQVQQLSVNAESSVDEFLKVTKEHERSLLHDIAQLGEIDGFATWRELEATELSNLVQKRLKYLQNPADCESAKKLVCNLNKGCGFGCQLHHVVYCLLVAYGTERTLILKSKGWKYNKGGWEEKFKPISDTCTDTFGENGSTWPGTPETQVLTISVIDSISPRPPYLPPAIPEDLAPRLIRLHGDPIVWWIGQFLKYLMKPQEKTSALMQDTMYNIGFKRPIVGVHIRRTDKVGTEASFHSVNEYMAVVEDYYDQLELKGSVEKRRIYLATDDPKVLAEAKKNYPSYEILGDASISKTASISTRYSEQSLNGIILDIHMLSMSDYLVCTFSSQVCRVAYEIMQNYFPDASDKFKSLDDIYYFGGQNQHNRVALLPHTAQSQGEINLNVNDLVGVAGNHWNGYSKGKNLRTKQTGLYPSFKVQDKVETVKFPTYAKATNKNNDNDNV
nr:alpha-(1,6)-fucosyltransferase [Onthophagus taurus]